MEFKTKAMTVLETLNNKNSSLSEKDFLTEFQLNCLLSYDKYKFIIDEALRPYFKIQDDCIIITDYDITKLYESVFHFFLPRENLLIKFFKCIGFNSSNTFEHIDGERIFTYKLYIDN